MRNFDIINISKKKDTRDNCMYYSLFIVNG